MARLHPCATLVVPCSTVDAYSYGALERVRRAASRASGRRRVRRRRPATRRRTSRRAHRRRALKAEKNALTAQIAKAADRAAAARDSNRRSPRSTRASPQRAKSSRELEHQIDRDRCADVPNLLDDSVPDGAAKSDNVSCARGARRPTFDFTPKPHWEIGEALGILDFERAAKLSGSRFAVLRGKGARLSRALVNFFLDRAAARGYAEIVPPLLVTRETMWSTGQLTKFADAMFVDPDADLFMIPTSEVPLTALHRDEILAGDELPLQYTAYTPCFRKEAGAAGKDTRGLIRQHQFEKVELVWLTAPERSFDGSRAARRRRREALLEELGLPHRVDRAVRAATSASTQPRPTTSRSGCRGRAPIAKSVRVRTAPTSKRGARQIRFRRDAKAKPELVAHAQRFGSRHRAHAGRDPRKLSARRRQRPRPRRARPLHPLRPHRLTRPFQELPRRGLEDRGNHRLEEAWTLPSVVVRRCRRLPPVHGLHRGDDGRD